MAYPVQITQAAHKWSRVTETTWLDKHTHPQKLLNLQDRYQRNFQEFSRGIHVVPDVEVAGSPSGWQPLS